MRYLIKRGSALILAFDHGFEHGPAKYNNIDMSPKRIMDIAIKGSADALMVNKGIAKQIPQQFRKDVALIVKLTGRTAMSPVMTQGLTGTIDDAIELDADAVAVTVYIGNEYEDEMLTQFSELYSDAKKHGFPVMGIIYPRPENGKRYKGEYIRYAARVGSELGCDLIKTYYPEQGKQMFARVVKDAFCPVVAAGGALSKGTTNIFKVAENVIDTGGFGMAVGRNIWMRDNSEAIKVLKQLSKIIKKK